MKLVADPRIAAVTLTGSERAGAAVAIAAGGAIKKCVLELGGSDPFIVFSDADLDAAATTAVKARFQNNGQSCIAAKRFIVEAPVYGEFLERFVERAAGQVVGNPMEERVQLGPCARADLRETMHEQVTATIDRGARLVLGGTPREGRGFFYEPTSSRDVMPGMRMFDEEVFGPAAAVVRADDPTTHSRLANESSFGLGSSVWTRDVAAAEEFARAHRSRRRLHQRDGRERPAPTLRRRQEERLRPRALRLRHPRVRQHSNRLDRRVALNPARSAPLERADRRFDPRTLCRKDVRRNRCARRDLEHLRRRSRASRSCRRA